MRANIRAFAATDIEAAISYYKKEAGRTVANGFVDELEAAISHLCLHPASGSLRFAYELNIAELRSWPIQKFPYLIFYIADDEHIDIWRVLHARRDIPSHLAAEPLD